MVALAVDFTFNSEFFNIDKGSLGTYFTYQLLEASATLDKYTRVDKIFDVYA